MSLAARAGELFMVGFRGTEPDGDVESLVRDDGVGAVILFARNLEEPVQVRRLTDRIQACSPALPLLVATDQEGGIVLRIGGDGAAATPWPGPMSLGAGGDLGLTRRVGAGIARELRAMGVNMNLAPVLDVNVNPSNPVIGVRSFGSDPDQVAEHGAAYIEGHHDAGVLATAKHFPGHGDTAVDSHLALAAVPHGLDRLEAVELVPFRRAIAVGVDAVMMAHVVFPAVEPDPGVPATLSPAVLTGLLRHRLGYDGLVITDCMEMKAIADHVGTVEGAVRAIAAGADLVLISHSSSLQREAIAAVRAAIESGRIPTQRAEEALRRVRAARERLARLAGDPALASIGTAEHRTLAAEAAAASITAVGDVASLAPVQPERTLLLACDPAPVVEVEERALAGSPVLQAAAELAPSMHAIGIRRDPSPAEMDEVLAAADGVDRVLVATYLAHRFPGQAALVQRLLAAGHRVILLPQRGPYDLQAIPGVEVAVVTYEDRRLPAEAAIRFLLGQGSAPGRLPVNLTGVEE